MVSKEDYDLLLKKYESLKNKYDLIKDENATLRAKLYGRRKSKNDDEKPSKKKRKKKGAPNKHSGWYRKKTKKADEIIDVELEKCPDCGNEELNPCSEIKEHFQEDIIIPEIKTTLYRKRKYYCSNCKKTFIGKGKDELSKSYIGPTAKSIASVLKYDIKISDRDINKIFKNLFGLKIDTSSISGFRNQLRKKCESLYKNILSELKKSSFLHADETGWVKDGDNHWLWSFSNKKLVFYHIDKSRGQKVVNNILGDNYNGILISDFYSAYNKIKALAKQKCIPHLVRELDKVIKKYNDDKIIFDWCFELKKLLFDAVLLDKKRKNNKCSDKYFLRKRNKIIERLENFKFPNKIKNDLNRLSKRIIKFKDELFTFLFYDNIDFHNNHAEQQIRPNVILRKITFGNRSDNGVLNHNVLMSIIQSIKLNKKILELSESEIVLKL